ncbi:MAG TPA: dethiobiotin synthase [Usitatibacter sp.]|nr:dethiobiotin synthase [Usitatibacter sp.]
MSRGVFVTGTDTGVGKTLAACALLHALRARGVAACPMKPIAAGARGRDGRWINEDTEALLLAAGWPAERATDVTPILLREPMAPHIAAAREGCTIDIARVEASFANLASQGFVVVEGVGGFRVPLGRDHDSADLAVTLGLPVILVVGMRLGCLNHALLTQEAVKARGLALAGWIASAIDPEMPASEENVTALRERIPAPLLGLIPHSPLPDARRAARSLDIASLLPV